MKKLISVLAIAALVSLQSCTVAETKVVEAAPYTDNDTYPEAFEIKNVNLAKVANNEYNLKSTFKFEIGGDLYDDETVLVYRMTGLINTNTPIWQLIPRTIYLSNGDILDYYYDFSKVDFIITARGSYNLLNTPTYIDNQTFRIVIIPSKLSKKVDTNNMEAVMNAANLKEKDVKKISLK
jgi:hypothetical protein